MPRLPQTTPLCNVCVCALNIPTLSEFICPDNAILVQLRFPSNPLATPPFVFYLHSFIFSIEIEIVTVTAQVGERDGTSVD